MPAYESTEGAVWERASFTVPSTVPDQTVLDGPVAERYIRRFGAHLEKQGFEVLTMVRPEAVRSQVLMDTPDRKRFVMWAKVRRRPVTIHFDIPDHLIEAAQQVGFKLNK